MRKFLTLFFFSTVHVFAQESFSKEFSFSTDNDLFVSYVKDQYYSSGLFFTYSFLHQKNTLEKRIKFRSLEHKIFTPYKSILRNREEHDRPFAGLLYLSFGNIHANEKRLKENSYQIGIMGPAALGKEFQMFIHDIYGFVEPVGWKYQVRNSLLLNYSFKITKKLVKIERKYSDSFYSYGFTAGTVHTHFSSSIEGRIGFRELASMQKSIAFKTHLDTDNTRNIESFLHWKIRNKIVIFDATMQGGIFDEVSPVTFNPNRFQFAFELGYFFTSKQWNFGYKIVYNTNERESLVNNSGHWFGHLTISKLFN